MIDVSSVYIYFKPLEINTSWVKSLCRTTELCSTRANSSQLCSNTNQSFSSIHGWLYFSDKDFMPLQFKSTELCRTGLSIAKLWLPPGRKTPLRSRLSRRSCDSGCPAKYRGSALRIPRHLSSVHLGTFCIALNDGAKGWNTHKATPSFS